MFKFQLKDTMLLFTFKKLLDNLKIAGELKNKAAFQVPGKFLELQGFYATAVMCECVL